MKCCRSSRPTANLSSSTSPIRSRRRQESVDQHNSFIQLDHYGQFPFPPPAHLHGCRREITAGAQSKRYGVLPWQIGIYSQKLTDAFRAHDWDDAKLSAALLAHYVAAAHDPFKSTMNSDGQLSDQPGVNERFGRGLVDRYQLFFFLKPNEAALIHDPTDHAFEMSLSAHAWLENILLADRRAHEGLTGYDDEYYDRFYAQAGAVLDPPDLGRFHRSRVILDDCMDQRWPPAIAGALTMSLVTQTTSQPTILDALPKAELHLHLEGLYALKRPSNSRPPRRQAHARRSHCAL